MRAAFTKMHGLGNDFVVLDTRTQPLPPVTPALARALKAIIPGELTAQRSLPGIVHGTSGWRRRLWVELPACGA